MKGSLLIILFFCSISLAAQTYHPFPTKNAMWVETYHRYSIFDEPEFHCYALKDQDTILNGKLYHKIYHSLDTIFTEDKLCGGIREENKRVYFYPIDSIGYLGQMTYPSKKTEFVLYDFLLQEGDSIDSDTFRLSLADYPGYLKVFKGDSILIGQQYRKAFYFGMPSFLKPIPRAVWVEGIGNLKGLLFETGEECECGPVSILTCFYHENINLYHSGTNDCFYYMNHTGTNISWETKKLTIKPNPANKSAIVEFDENYYSKLKLVNLFGVVFREYNIKRMTSLEIYKERLPSGIYILVFEDSKGNLSTAKLIFE